MLEHFAQLADRSIDYLRSFFDGLAINTWTFIKTNPVLLLILFCSSVLRLWELSSHAIFFGDAGRDFLAAYEMIATGQIPLKGIPTSIPIFHQGPLMIWYLGAVLWMSNLNTEMVFLLTAMFGTLTVGLLYQTLEYSIKDKSVATIASIILAFSPLAVAHSRMSYHITFIPLLTLCYVLSLTKVARNEKYGVFLSAISWGLLFQLELSLFPFIIGIPYVMWKYKKISRKTLQYVSIGCGLTFIPFVVQFPTVIQFLSQRLSNGSKILQEFQEISQEFIPTVQNFWLYFGRFFNIDQKIVSFFFLGMLTTSMFIIIKKFKSLPAIVEITVILSVVLTLAYTVRGVPSEAYMPPYFIFLPILLAYGMNSFSKNNSVKKVLLVLLIGWTGWSSISIFHNNFFVLPTSSNFHYGVSYGEQKQIINTIYRETKGKSYYLDSTTAENKFPSFLDNFRYIGKTINYPEEKDTKSIRYFIENKNSLLLNYPNADIIAFPSLYLINIPDIQ